MTQANALRLTEDNILFRKTQFGRLPLVKDEVLDKPTVSELVRVRLLDTLQDRIDKVTLINVIPDTKQIPTDISKSAFIAFQRD